MDLEDFKEKFEIVPVRNYPHGESDQLFVSICVQTYQHVKYIRQCLEGIVMQQTNFDFEILLGEDASTDGTREICIEYAEKYPNRIRLFLHRRENNISIDETPTGRFNFAYNLYRAKGKYIALCEGDDYWIDPMKLQKQVDFLEANKNVVLTFHDVHILEEGALKQIKETTDISVYSRPEEMLEIHAPTCSLVFRNVLGTLPDQFMRAPFGDKFIIGLLAQHGSFAKLDFIGATYRRHNAGLWTGLKHIDRIKKRIQTYLLLSEVVPEAQASKIRKIVTQRSRAGLFKAIRQRNLNFALFFLRTMAGFKS